MAYSIPRYRPTPTRMEDSTRDALLCAADRCGSPSIRVLLDHIAWLEEERDGIRHLLYEEFHTMTAPFWREELNVIVRDRAAELERARNTAYNAPPPRMVWDGGTWRPEDGMPQKLIP